MSGVEKRWLERPRNLIEKRLREAREAGQTSIATTRSGMTIIISLLPLGMLGGIAGYVFMKSREPAPTEADRVEP